MDKAKLQFFNTTSNFSNKHLSISWDLFFSTYVWVRFYKKFLKHELSYWSHSLSPFFLLLFFTANEVFTVFTAKYIDACLIIVRPVCTGERISYFAQYVWMHHECIQWFIWMHHHTLTNCQIHVLLKAEKLFKCFIFFFRNIMNYN